LLALFNYTHFAIAALFSPAQPRGCRSAIVLTVAMPLPAALQLECPECRSAKAVIITDRPWNRLAFCPVCDYVWNHAQTARHE